MKPCFQFGRFCVLDSKRPPISKLLLWMFLCALLTSILQGCAVPEAVQARRLGARWNSLNVAKSTEDLGKVPRDWTAGVFIRTPVLQSCANLVDNTEISYHGTDSLLKGTKITVKNISLR